MKSFFAIVLSAGAGVGIGFAAHRYAPPFPPLYSDPVATASATAEPDASASAPLSASAPASASAPPMEKPSLCMKPLFAEKTFPDEPPLDFVCDEPNVIKGASRVREAVVNAGQKKTTPGMKEWAVLGFYEVAAYATLRGRCCPGEPKLEAPGSPEKCEVVESLTKIALASKPGSSNDDATAATKAYAEAVKCIVRSKASKTFGDPPPPTGGEGSVFQKTYDRARGVEPKPG